MLFLLMIARSQVLWTIFFYELVSIDQSTSLVTMFAQMQTSEFNAWWELRVDIKIYAILMLQLINDDASRNERRTNQRNERNNFILWLPFCEMFYCWMCIKSKTKTSEFRYKLHWTECTELKFLRTRNARKKHNSDLHIS